jgi:hypothetical protein
MKFLVYFFWTCLLILQACTFTASDSKSDFKISPKDLIGKTIEYRYGESIYHVTLDTDSTMHWEAMAGDEKGALEDETYIIESVDDSKMLITWGEANGIGVSQVLDFEKGIVYNHLLRGRDLTIGRGEIKILP